VPPRRRRRYQIKLIRDDVNWLQAVSAAAAAATTTTTTK